MPSSKTLVVDEYPSLIWITLPPILLLSAFFARKWYLARKLRLTGIGKGAPGFQTGVRRIRVTPEIAARIRRGEDVSPDEIAAASKKADEDEASGSSAARRDVGEMHARNTGAGTGTESEGEKGDKGEKGEKGKVNEWLPENLTTPKKRAKGKRR